MRWSLLPKIPLNEWLFSTQSFFSKQSLSVQIAGRADLGASRSNTVSGQHYREIVVVLDGVLQTSREASH